VTSNIIFMIVSYFLNQAQYEEYKYITILSTYMTKKKHDLHSTERFTKSYTKLEAYMNLFIGRTERFELS
jgi:hypothetical protein